MTQIDDSTVEVKLGTKPAVRFSNLSPAQIQWLLGLVGPPLLDPSVIDPLGQNLLKSADSADSASDLPHSQDRAITPLSIQDQAATPLSIQSPAATPLSISDQANTPLSNQSPAATSVSIQNQATVPPKKQRPRGRTRPSGYGVLMAGLRSAGVVMKTTRKPPDSPVPLGAWHPETVSLNNLGFKGTSLVAHRTGAVIAFSGVSRATLTAISTLAAAGVHNFVIDDPRPIDPTEFLYEGLSLNLTQTRQAVVRDFLAKNLPHVMVLPRDSMVDVVVVAGEEVTNPLTVAGLYAQRITHLVTIGFNTHIQVGPFVIPGETGCCNCLLLASTTAAQRQDFAAYSSGLTTAAIRAWSSPARQSAAAARVAGGIIAGQVLMYLDGLVPQLTKQLLEISSVGPVPIAVPWTAHSDCMCLADEAPATHKRQRVSVGTAT